MGSWAEARLRWVGEEVLLMRRGSGRIRVMERMGRLVDFGVVLETFFVSY